jgi:hypothetical protein
LPRTSIPECPRQRRENDGPRSRTSQLLLGYRKIFFYYFFVAPPTVTVTDRNLSHRQGIRWHEPTIKGRELSFQSRDRSSDRRRPSQMATIRLASCCAVAETAVSAKFALREIAGASRNRPTDIRLVFRTRCLPERSKRRSSGSRQLCGSLCRIPRSRHVLTDLQNRPPKNCMAWPEKLLVVSSLVSDALTTP